MKSVILVEVDEIQKNAQNLIFSYCMIKFYH